MSVLQHSIYVQSQERLDKSQLSNFISCSLPVDIHFLCSTPNGSNTFVKHVLWDVGVCALAPPQELTQHHYKHGNIVFLVSRHHGNKTFGGCKKMILGNKKKLFGLQADRLTKFLPTCALKTPLK